MKPIDKDIEYCWDCQHFEQSESGYHCLIRSELKEGCNLKTREPGADLPVYLEKLAN